MLSFKRPKINEVRLSMNEFFSYSPKKFHNDNEKQKRFRIKL